MSGVTRSNRLTCALSLLKTLEADASTKVTASLDALSDDFAEVVPKHHYLLPVVSSPISAPLPA